MLGMTIRQTKWRRDRAVYFDGSSLDAEFYPEMKIRRDGGTVPLEDQCSEQGVIWPLGVEERGLSKALAGIFP
jgi:hypothetical protein